MRAPLPSMCILFTLVTFLLLTVTSSFQRTSTASTVSYNRHIPLYANMAMTVPGPAQEQAQAQAQAMELSAFKVPYLTPREKMTLAAGERVQKQDRKANCGSGLVVVDIPANADLVFETLTRFSMYQDMIPTVRSSRILSTSSNGVHTVAEFTLSRFLLRVNVEHQLWREQRTIMFRLDKSRPNLVFEEAEGFWHVQVPADRPKGYSRVYLTANIVAARMIPPLILDYAAARALPRATKWMLPYFTGRRGFTVPSNATATADQEHF
jgi:hypothetical protein